MQQKYKSFLREALVLLAMVVVVSIAVNFFKTKDVVGSHAPELNATTINGMPVNLGDTDKPVLVHFWGSWCPICTIEHGTIQSIARDHAVITVASTSGDAAELQQYMQDNQLDFPVVADEHGEIASRWAVTGVPRSYIVLPNGEIAFAEAGYSTEIGLRTRLWWAGLN